MRIVTDDLTPEKAVDIIEWMEDPRAQLFYNQLAQTEKAIFERWLQNPSDQRCPNQIQAIRSIVVFHDHVLDFLRERVDAQNNKNN